MRTAGLLMLRPLSRRANWNVFLFCRVAVLAYEVPASMDSRANRRGSRSRTQREHPDEHAELADLRGPRLGRPARAPQAHPRRHHRAGLEGRLRRRPDAGGRRARRRRPRDALPLLPLQDPPARLRPRPRVRAGQRRASTAGRSRATLRTSASCTSSAATTRGAAARPEPHRGAHPRVHVRRRVGGQRDPRRRHARHPAADARDGGPRARRSRTTSRPRTTSRSPR